MPNEDNHPTLRAVLAADNAAKVHRQIERDARMAKALTQEPADMPNAVTFDTPPDDKPIEISIRPGIKAIHVDSEHNIDIDVAIKGSVTIRW